MSSLDNYVRDAWYVAAWSHDLTVGEPFSVTILGEPLVLWRGSDGAPAALADRCVHRLAPLSLGRCEGDNLRCMYHGLLYDPHGTVLEIPGQDLIPPRARVKAYPAVDRHGWIWAWMGDPAKADPSHIPPAIGLDHPDYIMGWGELDYAADAHLICDNLLDFSHLSYVHPTTFGASPDWARGRPKVTPLDRAVRFERWVADQEGLGPREAARVDIWNSYEFHIPGILLMPLSSYPVGTAQSCPEGPPEAMEHAARASFTSQAVTPLTEQTSRYFFCWGPPRTSGDAAERDEIMAMAHAAFAEDKVMIEAQQQVISRSPERRMMAISSDTGVELYHRILRRLRQSERARTETAPEPA